MTIQTFPEFRAEFKRQLPAARKSSVISETLANIAIKEPGELDAQEDSDCFGASIIHSFESLRLA